MYNVKGMVNFWQRLPRPFLVLAPMEDVTDFVFREIVATVLPHPDVFFTEFTSSDGLVSPGLPKVAQKLKLSEQQRPIVAQLWGNNPEKIFAAAKIVQNMGFDGVDLNMGCPERNVVRKGQCAGLIGNFDLTAELIEAARAGAPLIPVSVKTRIGIKEIITEDWITHLLKQNIQALTIHGRTAKQMAEGLTNWDEIAKAVKLRNEIAPNTIIIGNGDVESFADAKTKAAQFGVDGVMIGRGIFHDPWVFSETEKGHTKNEKIEVLDKHVGLFVDTWGTAKNFAIVKKFVKMYIKDFEGAKDLRQKLMAARNLEQVRVLLAHEHPADEQDQQSTGDGNNQGHRIETGDSDSK